MIHASDAILGKGAAKPSAQDGIITISGADSRYADRHRPRAPGPFAIIEGNVLKQLGKRGVREGVGDVPLSDVSKVAGATPLDDAADAKASALVLNASVFMPVIVRALLEHAADEADLRDSIDALRLSEKRLN